MICPQLPPQHLAAVSHRRFCCLYCRAERRKTRGMGAGRKLRSLRREERWADKDYNRSHLGRCVGSPALSSRGLGLIGAAAAALPPPPHQSHPSRPRSEYKKPFAGASHAKGIVLEKM
jgi:small subunit ribosomal protein S23e